MGIYENQTQKKVEIDKQLNSLQLTLEEVDYIVHEKQYDDLYSHINKLHEFYTKLCMINNMGVGLK